MENEKVLICYLPTKIMFVDDNQRFLKNIKYKIDEKQPYVLYDNPEQALSYLKNEYQTNPHIGTFSNSIESYDASQTHSAFDLDVGQISQQATNPKRFNEISVLIIDYSMPTIDGINFCKNIKELPIKKILVTGEADETIAVTAFNAKDIDRFILKSDPNFDEVLNSYIHTLQQEYFQEITKNAFDMLRHNESFCLNNPSVISVFNKIKKEKNIVEYYLMDTAGSFLLLDEEANLYWFMLQNEDDRRMYLDFAIDNDAPRSLISSLETDEKIIYLPNINDIVQIQSNEWETVSYPATKLDNSICFSLTKHISGQKIDTSKLISFADYLEDK